MRAHLFVGISCVIVLLDGTLGQTKISSSDGTRSEKQETKKQIPTFVGSDGIVRKVSPATILDEMKRCLPPGLPIPMATAWPELPTHLEELPESTNVPQATLDEGSLKDLSTTQEKKRVSRSNDAEMKNMDAPNDQSMSVKLEGPTNDFSPKDLSQKKMAEVLKVMLSKQMRRPNLTGEYIDDFNIRPRQHKSKSDDYEDYDYIDPEEPNFSHTRTKINRYPKSFQAKRRVKPKRDRRNNQERRGSKRRQNELRKRPDYEDDYEQSNENTETHQNKKVPQHTKSDSDQIQNDELEKQIELNDFLEKNLDADGIPERMENIDKFIKRSRHFKTRSGEPMEILEGYQKMMAVIMKLNTTLIRLLDRFSMLVEKGSDAGGNQNEDTGKSAVIWDFMDLLMQQRRGARRKRDNSQYLQENPNVLTKDSATDSYGTRKIESSTSRTNLDLLKWLLKWYLKANSRT